MMDRWVDGLVDWKIDGVRRRAPRDVVLDRKVGCTSKIGIHAALGVEGPRTDYQSWRAGRIA